MKALALVLVSLTATGGGSIGVGLDVLPVAYTFAANRIDFFPDLRLTKCDRTSCRWATGHATELVAYVSGWDLAVKQLEVDALDVSLASENEVWFERACLTVVALTMSGADRAEVKEIADSILSKTHAAKTVRLEREVGAFRFYGSSTPSVHNADGIRERCGAVGRGNH